MSIVGPVDTNFSIYTNNDHRRHAYIRVPIADQEGYGMGFIRRATQECQQGYREVLEATKDSIACNHDIASRTRLKPWVYLACRYHTTIYSTIILFMNYN